MLVPAVKQRAGNNLIMRLEMPGRGGRCRPSAAHAPPAACGARELSGCLLPLTLLLISSPPCCRAGRWGRAPPPCRPCTDPQHIPSVRPAARRCSPRAGCGHGRGEDGRLCSLAARGRGGSRASQRVMCLSGG